MCSKLYIIHKISKSLFVVFQLIFEGVRGENWRGDIAIDDVIIIQGVCSTSKLKTYMFHVSYIFHVFYMLHVF